MIEGNRINAAELVTRSDSDSDASQPPPENCLPLPHSRPVVERKDLPTKIIVFHDAENCFLGSNSGLQADDLYFAVIEEIRLVAGLPHDTLVMGWDLFLPRSEPQQVYQHPTTRTMETLINCGVRYICTSIKDDSVDVAMADAISTFIHFVAPYGDADRGRAGEWLVVLLTGDRDIAGPLRNLGHHGFKTMVMHGYSPLSQGFPRNADWVSGRWSQLVANATAAPPRPTVERKFAPEPEVMRKLRAYSEWFGWDQVDAFRGRLLANYPDVTNSVMPGRDKATLVLLQGPQDRVNLAMEDAREFVTDMMELETRVHTVHFTHPTTGLHLLGPRFRALGYKLYSEHFIFPGLRQDLRVHAESIKHTSQVKLTGPSAEAVAQAQVMLQEQLRTVQADEPPGGMGRNAVQGIANEHGVFVFQKPQNGHGSARLNGPDPVLRLIGPESALRKCQALQ